MKFAALALVSIAGLFFIDSANFSPWNAGGGRALSAVGGGMSIALFGYLGVEAAAVAAAKVRDPERNVPRATILGMLATAVVYVLSLVAVFSILPAGTRSTWAPFFLTAGAFLLGVPVYRAERARNR